MGRRETLLMEKRTEKRKLTPLELTAYHEAGHAVARYLLRISFKYVTIEPDAKRHSLGHVRSTRPKSFRFDVDTDNRTRIRAEEEIMAALAGGIAEHHRVGRRNNQGAATDWENALDIASAMTDSPEEANAHLNWLWFRTKNLLTHPFYWPGVEAIAKALLEKRRLTASEVRDNLRSNSVFPLG